MKRAIGLPGAIGLAASVAIAATSASPAPSFSDARTYATGRYPISIAIHDLNGDRKPDLAVSNAHANTVSVLLRSGGGFQANRDYATGLRPRAVAAGDLNGDGKPDLATANLDANTVSVLLNGGSGKFQEETDYPTGTGAISIAVGDLNGDRKPDLVTADIDGTLSVLLNKCDGSFRAKRSYPAGASPFSVVVRDLNGDGKSDLATVNQDASTVSVLLNKGHGSFRPRRVYRVGEDSESDPESLAVGDLNGDSKPDLVAGNAFESTVYVLLNRGNGSFRPKRDYRTGYNSTPRAVAIGDLNGDGKPELATANEDLSTVSVLVNRGNGTFQAKLEYAAGRRPIAVAIRDLNGDGKPDLAAASGRASTVSVLINKPGLCTVQNLRGKLPPAAENTIARANCRVGKVRRGYSKTVERGRVASQSPKPGTVLPGGSKVDFVVSLGRG